jgi:isopentenyl diphosphate isomerase/L-lactate dehydrogenase-like FMN-dependent dehydrogenase
MQKNRAPVNVAEYEALAEDKLTRHLFDFLSGGACDEFTLRRNVAAFQRMLLLPRVLRDVAERDLSTTLLGQPASLPIVLAPVGCLRYFHPEAECAVARAASAAGIICTVSSGASCSLEEVAASADGVRWFQLYALRDREVTRTLVQRAEESGYEALCLTVDAAAAAKRDRNRRNRFISDQKLIHEVLTNIGFDHLSADLSSQELESFALHQAGAPLTWETVDWLQSITRLPLVLKGILHRDDALKAVEHGVAGIVISNHGGRQLDTSPATLEVLEEITQAAADRLEVFIDGGIRRGTDVIKALALGAKAVLVGRPYVWALAAAGQEGVANAIDMLRDELDRALALCGCSRVAEVDRSLVRWSERLNA